MYISVSRHLGNMDGPSVKEMKYALGLRVDFSVLFKNMFTIHLSSSPFFTPKSLTI